MAPVPSSCRWSLWATLTLWLGTGSIWQLEPPRMLTISFWSSNGAVKPPFEASRSELASESSSCHEVALGDTDPLELRLPNSFPYSSLLHENTLAKLRELTRCFPRSPGQKWLVATSSCHWSLLATLTLWKRTSPFLPLIFLPRRRNTLSSRVNAHAASRGVHVRNWGLVLPAVVDRSGRP